MTGYDFTSEPAEADLMQQLLAAHPALLSRDELADLASDPVVVTDALTHLKAHGLVHEFDGFVWASWTAMAAEEVITA
jgi:hypothetical protein